MQVDKLTANQESLLYNIQHSGIPGWFRPLDVGGRNGTGHSAILSQLERKGLVESKQRSGWTGRRGSKVYRLTDAGRTADLEVGSLT